MGTKIRLFGLVAVLTAFMVLLLCVPAMAYDSGDTATYKLVRGDDGWYLTGPGNAPIKLNLVQKQAVSTDGTNRVIYHTTYTYTYTYPYPVKYTPKPYTPKQSVSKPPAPPAEDNDPALEPPQTPGSSQLSADERAMLDLVNKERTKLGLNPLQADMRLTELARKKSKDMIDKKYFAHNSPTYGSPFDMMKAAGIAYKFAGENLAGAPTVSRAHTALMNSPGHRANILNKNFTHVGIGVVDGGPYGKMFTQMFIGK